MNQTAATVDAYYDLLAGGLATFDEERLLRLLAPDLVFEGPIAGRRVGATGFAKGVAGFVGAHRGLAVQQRVDSTDAAASLYEAELPGGPVRFAEFFGLEDGVIATLRLLFDATDYRAKGGR